MGKGSGFCIFIKFLKRSWCLWNLRTILWGYVVNQKWHHLLSVGGPPLFLCPSVEPAPQKCYPLEVWLGNICANTCIPDGHICTACTVDPTSVHVMHHLLNSEWLERLMRISHRSLQHIRVIFFFWFFSFFSSLFTLICGLFLFPEQELQGLNTQK